MQTVRQHRRSFSAIALFAMLVLALVPTLSRALSLSGSAGPWAEVCSAADESGPKAPASGLHVEHCPLCSHGASAPALPPAPVVFEAAQRDGAAFLPALFTPAPHALYANTRAQPRAPPGERLSR